MRKILMFLSAITLSLTTSTSIIACGVNQKLKIVISNKIGNSIDLGQLNANTADEFKNVLQTKLRTNKDLTNITTGDYDIYKANTTTDITDSDVDNGTSLNIKIVAKGNNFTGVKNNINVTYIKLVNNDLNTIITNKSLDNIFISTKDIPDKKDILEAIKRKNQTAQRLTINDFEFKLNNETTTIIIGANHYTGEIIITYVCTNFSPMNGADPAIKSLRVDTTTGNVYAGSDNGKVYKSDGTSDFTTMNGTSGIITSLTSDQDSNVYAGSSNGKVYKLTNNTSEFTPMNGTNGIITSLTSDQNNNIYAGSDKVVYKSDGTSNFTPIKGTSGKIFSITSDQNNNIYAGNSNGKVYKLINNTSKFTPMNGTSGKIFSITSDQNNNIYAGSDNGKVYKSDGTSEFTPMNSTSGKIFSITSDQNNNIYAGSDNGKVYKLTNNTSEFKEMNGTSGKIFSLTSDQNNNIYAGSDKVVYKS